ncbi:phosphonate C-P lyase system protein PhnG [Rhodovulum sp. BSW8]|uniref:Phosphonate C-P lyase system protein PhnG n=2 Tax=Rhodovulum visakhapatnamense TaxID=364297 RepID=A0ABS1RKZ3_9RHOB|nr:MULTISPECIES: phosphonate C-P lyase system protein PhnG [Rhodovulum]MBL3569710.1 phosphonate C-P lyase system protein PhnG [Rhodovulum visakhapatnamense]MBL3580189.1 phosphonate C-P lyase system protein PhnG [Rhodovulum visakhapatnamense]OLS44582.1 phosphonate C-P lyase system protein PhnG [Rhodovulum sulfidophilum]RBO51833.1 phosphonate C-P lyase system protein PhnG [Rhodovulum sp. BSW8]
MTEPGTRREWMGLLARAPAATLERLWISLGPDPEFAWLRPPETGGVMVRGRMGGTGAPFNLGEVTVTRCALRLQEGRAVGHAWVQGRDKAKARRAALADALMQTGRADDVRARLLDPLAEEMAAAETARAARAAATRVEFFTMVRGED